MRRAWGFVAGVAVGFVLAMGLVSSSPPGVGVHAWTSRALHDVEAMRPEGRVRAAALSGPAHQGLGVLQVLGGLGAGMPAVEDEAVTVPLEPSLGVWVVAASLDGGRPARFLVDTGSSVVIVAPRVAAAVGIKASPNAPRIELHTVAGRSAGPTVRVRSLRVGDLELLDVPVVLHDPGAGFDGILGNAFLSRYRLTLDPDRHLLVLRPLASPVPVPPARSVAQGSRNALRPPHARSGPAEP